MIHCDENGCRENPKYIAKIKIWGKCHPSDCAWGEEEVYRHSDGTWKYVNYDQGFGNKLVWLKKDGDRMTAVMDASYRDGRPDRRIWNTLRKIR